MLLLIWKIGPGGSVKLSFPQCSCPLSSFGDILVIFDGGDGPSFVPVSLLSGLVTASVSMIR